MPRYSVIAADTLRDLVTLTYDLLTLVSGHTWLVTWSTPPPSLKILWLSVLDISHRIPLTGEGRSLGGKISGGRGRPPTNILIPLERQLIALQLCR